MTEFTAKNVERGGAPRQADGWAARHPEPPAGKRLVGTPVDGGPKGRKAVAPSSFDGEATDVVRKRVLKLSPDLGRDDGKEQVPRA